MQKFTGLVYVKHGRIGSRSEGPDYYLQTTRGEFLLHYQKRLLFQPDYNLEFFCRRMVEIEGVLQAPRLIEVTIIREILSGMLPPMKAPEEPPQLGEPVHLKAGQTCALDEAAMLTFLEVAEDSRCPPGVLCIWEGRAVVRMRITPAGIPAIDFSLTQHAGNPVEAEAVVAGYKIVLHGLEPPSRPEAGGEAYVATLIVEKIRQPGGDPR